MEKKITLVTGGARSGKTAYALKRMLMHEAPYLYIATGEPLDDEMELRIARHREERKGMGIETVEEPLDIAGALKSTGSKYSAIMLDCLTLWLSNIMSKGMDVDAEAAELVSAMKQSGASIYVVTNEVGLGIVPGNELARDFRDNAGRLNALVAKEAVAAWMMVSGLPLKLK